MVHAASGLLFPLLILFALSLPITLFWVFKGDGNCGKRGLIGFTQIAVLTIATLMCFSGVNIVQQAGVTIAFIILVIMLLTPMVFKNRSNLQD